MKNFFGTLIIGFIVVAIVWVYSAYTGSIRYAMDPLDKSKVIVTIESGMSAAHIGNLLEEKGLIKSSSAFVFYLRQNQVQDQIKAGRIVLSPSQTLPDIVEALVEGRTEEVPVTLLEGWTVQQIAGYLEESGVTTAEVFLDCVKTCEFDFDFLPQGYLEGYLYPDTYFVDPMAFSPQRFIERLIHTFEQRLSSADWTAISQSGRSLEQIVIMASIVEREERDSAERPTVAGILWNRFDAEIGLAADATILYALGRTKGGLTHEDLKVDSLYNTRKYRGLPPTPISNPSISSIRAALYPQKTDYWYYLHDAEGQVHYGKTLEDHNSNKVKYL
ncbi:MAG: endolytic transglycosylase MltG [Candidatus Peregrinibacteria bacterium]